MEKLITIDGVEYELTAVKQEQKEKRISGYYIAANATIIHTGEVPDTPNNYNLFATEKLAKRALAMARISQKMQNDARYGGLVTEVDWWDLDVEKWTIQRMHNSIFVEFELEYHYFLAFHTRQQAKLFLQENEELVREYYMLD